MVGSGWRKVLAVYLTAEADETLETFEPGVVYIIGGVVDRNRLPGIVADHAKKLDIPQKKLPIKEHISVGAGWRQSALS